MASVYTAYVEQTEHVNKIFDELQKMSDSDKNGRKKGLAGKRGTLYPAQQEGATCYRDSKLFCSTDQVEGFAQAVSVYPATRREASSRSPSR